MAIVQAGRLLWDRELIGGTEGNISIRLSENRILCTPAGVSKGDLDADALVEIDLDGFPTGNGVASSEIGLHLAIYRGRPDCRAIVHAHPPHATALSLCGETVPAHLTVESDVVLGPVALAPFAMPGTPEVATSIEPFLAGHKAILLSHHGAVTLGSDLASALNRMETLDRMARLVCLTRGIGPRVPMPESAQKWLNDHALNGEL